MLCLKADHNFHVAFGKLGAGKLRGKCQVQNAFCCLRQGLSSVVDAVYARPVGPELLWILLHLPPISL